MIDIVIPTYNNEQYTLNCLESIWRFTSNYRIIWIDNGSDSPGQIWDFLEDHGMPYISYRNPFNLGFVKAVNIGLGISTSDYVVLLNNDTEVVEGWLEKMLAVFEKVPDAGIVGPLCSVADTWQNVERIRRMPGMSALTYSAVVNTLAFFCVMIKRDVIKKVGYLSEEFGDGKISFGFGDDDWYCEAARRKGFKTCLALDVVIPHHHRTTFKSMFSQDEIRRLQDTALATYRRKCRDAL